MGVYKNPIQFWFEIKMEQLASRIIIIDNKERQIGCVQEKERYKWNRNLGTLSILLQVGVLQGSK